MIGVIGLIPDWFEDLGQEIGRAWPIVILCIFIFGMAKWIVKKLYDKYSSDLTDVKMDIMKELTPNGGSSIKDAIKRIEDGQLEKSKKLDEIRDIAGVALQLGSENAARLEALIANSHLAFFEMDVNKNVTRVNQEYLDIFQITEMEALSSIAWELVHPKDRDRLFNMATHAFDNRHPLITIAHFRPNNSDIYFKMEIRSFPKFLGDKFMGFVGTMAVMPDGISLSERISNLERLMQHHVDWEEDTVLVDRLPEDESEFTAGRTE